jgi:hypothetical protein
VTWNCSLPSRENKEVVIMFDLERWTWLVVGLMPTVAVVILMLAAVVFVEWSEQRDPAVSPVNAKKWRSFGPQLMEGDHDRRHSWISRRPS